MSLPSNITEWFSLAIWMAALANFCVLGAGVQLPFRLDWKNELPKLSSFNRKIFRVYHVFLGLTIITWGLLTFFLHDELLRGDRIAVILALVMGLWWLFRILVDFFVYEHDDWPKGTMFKVGHFMLCFAFVGMSGTYLSLVCWHWVF